jgi:hypothetical protein
MAAVSTTWVQYYTNPAFRTEEILGWNFIMHFALFLLAISLLDHVRKENILFVHREANGH